MKYFVIILFFGLIGFAGLFPLVNHAYGLWIPESPDTLLEQSQTIFVGNITSVNVLEFEKSSIVNIEENGVEKQIIENYTLSLDQYTVSVEKFLKNPQNSNTMMVLQPTTSIPGRVVPIGGFTAGDRVLFYLEKIDKENTYSPESFAIPKPCDAKSVLYKPRIIGTDFRITQDGIQRDDNFTAGIPMQFVYDIDTRTLEGKGYDFVVGIVKRLIDNSVEPVLKEKIHAKSNPCEWIASAKWEITPTAGKHIMAIQISEEDGSGGSHSTQFFVKENISPENKFPLKLDDLASELWYDHDYIIDGTILDIRGYDKPERIYDIQINSFFKPTEDTETKLITVYGFPNFDNVKGDRGIFFIKKEDAKWQFGQYGAKTTKECTPELMYHTPLLVESPLYHGAPTFGRDFTYAIDCYPYYYKKYLPQYMKAHGASEFPSPRTQAIDGVPSHEIVCNENLQVVIKHNGSPACVKPVTKQHLIDRGWAKTAELNEIQNNPNSLKLNIVRIEDGRVSLYPENTCASIHLELLSEHDIQRYRNDEKGLNSTNILQITADDLKEIPNMQELIYAVHSIDFPYNKYSSVYLNGSTFVEYEFFLMDKAIKKYGDSQEDYFIKLDKDYEERFTNPAKEGFSNTFEAPMIVYNDNAYSVDGTVFWTSDEHEPRRMGVYPKDAVDEDEKFVTLTDDDMKSVPKIKEAIENIGTIKESVTGFKGMLEDEWNQYREWFKQKSQVQLGTDSFRLIEYNDQLYSVGFAIC